MLFLLLCQVHAWMLPYILGHIQTMHVTFFTLCTRMYSLTHCGLNALPCSGQTYALADANSYKPNIALDAQLKPDSLTTAAATALPYPVRHRARNHGFICSSPTRRLAPGHGSLTWMHYTTHTSLYTGKAYTYYLA